MKILLIGDLRTAGNYGAIANSDSLIDLIKSVSSKNELKMIDFRSFTGNTPIKGLGDLGGSEDSNFLKEKVRDVTRKLGIYGPIKRAVNRNTELKTIGNSPARYDQYQGFANRVINGKTWQYEKKLIEWADIVLINSEGNIVHGTDKYGYYRFGGRYVLFAEYLSKIVLEKPTYVINHVVDPQNRDIEKIISTIYPKLDGVYVREEKSLKVLQGLGVPNGRYVPDALWAHSFETDTLVKQPYCLKNFDFSKPYICIGDSSGVVNNYSHVKWDVVKVYSKLISEIKNLCPNIIFIDGCAGNYVEINKIISKNKLRFVNLNNCNYHELYYILSHAQIFISGRWHASIMALLGHTPILLWGSDSHKTEALYNEVKYPYEFFDVEALPLNIDRIVKEAKRIIAEDHSKQWEIIEQLKKAAKNNVDMLISG